MNLKIEPMKRSNAIIILNEFIEKRLTKKKWYNDIKNYIFAMLFYGSVAKGLNRPDSDIDMLIILPLEIETKYTKGEYVYHYKKQEINIVLRSIERLRTIANEQNDKFQAEVFKKSEILWERDNEVRKLLERISQISKEQ